MEYCENERIKYGIQVPDILRSTTITKPGRVKGNHEALLRRVGIINKSIAEGGFGNGSPLNKSMPHEADERKKIITLEEKVAKLTDKVMILQTPPSLNISDIYISSEHRHGIILIS